MSSDGAITGNNKSITSGLSGSEINLVICVVTWEPVLFLG